MLFHNWMQCYAAKMLYYTICFILQKIRIRDTIEVQKTVTTDLS